MLAVQLLQYTASWMFACKPKIVLSTVTHRRLKQPFSRWHGFFAARTARVFSGILTLVLRRAFSTVILHDRLAGVMQC